MSSDSAITLRLVSGAAELYNIWDRVRAGLLEITGKTNDGYRPEDVYHEIKCERVKLFTMSIDNCYIGFFTARIDAVPDGRALHIWHLFHDGADADFIDRIMDSINKLSETIGANRFSFSSCRKGWIKLAEQRGYRPSSVMYFFERREACKHGRIIDTGDNHRDHCTEALGRSS